MPLDDSIYKGNASYNSAGGNALWLKNVVPHAMGPEIVHYARVAWMIALAAMALYSVMCVMGQA